MVFASSLSRSTTYAAPRSPVLDGRRRGEIRLARQDDPEAGYAMAVQLGLHLGRSSRNGLEADETAADVMSIANAITAIPAERMLRPNLLPAGATNGNPLPGTDPSAATAAGGSA